MPNQQFSLVLFEGRLFYLWGFFVWSMDPSSFVPPKDKEPVVADIVQSEDVFVNHQFLVKNTMFENKRVSFCVQSFDGPCPLLAMANVLLLRNKLRIKPGWKRSEKKRRRKSLVDFFFFFFFFSSVFFKVPIVWRRSMF
jgi:hypothetical protein